MEMEKDSEIVQDRAESSLQEKTIVIPVGSGRPHTQSGIPYPKL